MSKISQGPQGVACSSQQEQPLPCQSGGAGSVLSRAAKSSVINSSRPQWSTWCQALETPKILTNKEAAYAACWLKAQASESELEFHLLCDLEQVTQCISLILSPAK